MTLFVAVIVAGNNVGDIVGDAEGVTVEDFDAEESGAHMPSLPDTRTSSKRIVPLVEEAPEPQIRSEAFVAQPRLLGSGEVTRVHDAEGIDTLLSVEKEDPSTEMST